MRQFGEAGVFVSFEELPEDIVRNADSFGWDVSGMIAARSAHGR